MPEESLLTPEVRSLIGRSTEPVPVRITLRAVQRSMDVYLGHHDREFAPGDIVPGFVLVALEAEAAPVDLPAVMPDTLLISNEMQFSRPLRLGDELFASATVADISERFGGRFGYSLYFRSDIEFRDASGELVATSGRTMMQYDAASATGGEE